MIMDLRLNCSVQYVPWQVLIGKYQTGKIQGLEEILSIPAQNTHTSFRVQFIKEDIQLITHTICSFREPNACLFFELET